MIQNKSYIHLEIRKKTPKIQTVARESPNLMDRRVELGKNHTIDSAHFDHKTGRIYQKYTDFARFAYKNRRISVYLNQSEALTLDFIGKIKDAAKNGLLFWKRK